MKLHPRALRTVNFFLFGTVICVCGYALLAWFSLEQPTLAEPLPKKAARLPYSFAQEPSAVIGVGPPFVAQDRQTLKIALPDLRNTLLYFGSNVRPDVAEAGTFVQLGIRGNPHPSAIKARVPVYLKYESRVSNVRWAFNENNEPTSTWIEVTPQENSAEVKLYMLDSEARQITEPYECSYFTLAQMHMPFSAQNGNAFEIGGQRADASILIRQKAVWYGKDLFLQQYGGEEYAFAFAKERLDFLDPENRYTCFVGLGDCLAFSDGRWTEVTPGVESQGKPLLVVKKIDERVLSFDLWDPSGKIRVSIDLHKSMSIANFTAKFDMKLVGARSRKDWIAEIGKTRLFITADDWLLFNNDSWHKISTAEALDDYVSGNTRGVLLALEGTDKNGTDVGLVGYLYDETRTQQLPIRIAIFKSFDKSIAAPEEEDDDEDDEEDDDEDIEEDAEQDEEEDDDEDTI